VLYQHSQPLIYISHCDADNVLIIPQSYFTPLDSIDSSMTWHENRNDEVLIKHSRIPVSSSIMSQLLLEFHKLFTTQQGSLLKRIELPNEDPVVFGMICESAHSSFIPQDHISLQTLATMADAIQRYKIPAISRVHHTAEFSFAVQAFKLGTLSPI
jgi:hypothetical protein